jgi:hypothetical protein
MLDWLLGLIDEAQGAIFEHVLQPALYQLGLMGWSDELFDGVGFALFGALEIVLAYILLRPLEWWRPVERWGDRRAVRTDVVYSLVNRLGVVPAILFLLLAPIAAMIEGHPRAEVVITRRGGSSACPWRHRGCSALASLNAPRPMRPATPFERNASWTRRSSSCSPPAAQWSRAEA